MATPATPVPPNNELPPVPSRQATPPEDPEVARLRGEVARHRTTIDQMNRQLNSSAPAPPANQPADAATLNRMFYQNPVQNSIDIAKHVATEAVRQASEGAMETLTAVARNQARGTDPTQQKIFDKYLSEIEVAVASAPPQFRGNVTCWNNAFSYVKGQHMSEIMQEFYQQAPPVEAPRAPGVIIREGSGPSAPSARPNPVSASAELSQDEKDVARKLGLTEDQYKRGKVAVEEQPDPRTHPVGKSPWDEVITFNTKQLRKKQREARAAAQGGRAA